MGLETASYYNQLVATNPTGGDPFAEGDDHLRLIKSVIQSQWPNFNSATACTPSIGEINQLDGVTSPIQDQFDSNEAKLTVQQLPAEALDFNNSWWGQSGSADENRYYAIQAQKQQFSNVPWKWGSSIPSGDETDLLTIFVERFINNGLTMALQRVTLLAPDGGDGGRIIVSNYARGSFSSSTITNSRWWRETHARIDTTEGTSGDVVFTTVCKESETCT